MSVKITRRRARRAHPCCWGDCRTITPGETYLLHKAFPGDEAGYATNAGHPVTIAECSDCAKRYGRGDLLREAS